MHDIRAIRDDPAGFDAAMARRGMGPQSPAVLALDQARRGAILAAETAQAAQNAAARDVGAAKASGDAARFEALRATVAEQKAEGARLTAEADAADVALRDLLMGLPNIPQPSVPEGADEAGNVELRRWGELPTFEFKPVEHFEIAAAKRGLDFATAAKLSGSRFVVLRGAMARLHRALGQLMLDLHITEHGLAETWTPVLVKDAAMIGTNQLPKFANDSFFGASMNARNRLAEEAIDHAYTSEIEARLMSRELTFKQALQTVMEVADTKEDFWLIPTSEVTLTNTVAGETLDAATLPIRLTALSQCFRSEAGSAGRDTSGMLRQHQFEKVEMVSITTADQSAAEHDRMTGCAEAVLQRLGLPYRAMLLCAGDMGFGATKTHDLEVWLPGQDCYREISSVSVCGDFQARRMNARVRPAGGGKPEFVHTLNGSGLAVGRTLIAVLENGQRADGSVGLPQALHGYLGGCTRVEADGRLA